MKKKIIFTIILIAVAISIFLYFYYQPQKPSTNAEDDWANYAIIDKIQNQTSFHIPPLLSWNTKEYGRIYATICRAPKTFYPLSCQNCLDGGVSFYDRNGDHIGSCWGQMGDAFGWEAGYSCDVLSGLNYVDADYISEEAYETCPEL